MVAHPSEALRTLPCWGQGGLVLASVPTPWEMGWGWGPDLGAGVQELTGADAVPTVTLAAAAGDLSQILISRAAETPERASALDRRSTPPRQDLGGAPHRGMAQPQSQTLLC